MVEEGERAIPGHGTEPEGQFGEFDGQGIEINAIDARLHYAPLPVRQVCLTGRFFRGHVLYDEARYILGGLYQEVSTAHRGVQHFDRQDRLDLFLFA